MHIDEEKLIEIRQGEGGGSAIRYDGSTDGETGELITRQTPMGERGIKGNGRHSHPCNPGGIWELKHEGDNSSRRGWER